MVNLARIEPNCMKKAKDPNVLIPVFRPSITEEEIEAVAEVMRSGWLGLGPITKEFEEALADYFEAAAVVAVNSGTAALHLALALQDLEPEDEVLVPTMTFVSTAHAVRYCGAKVVFTDVCPDTLGMNIDDVQKKISEKTRAIIPVHYGGHPCDMVALQRLVRGKDITIIEDAAHACGATYQGKKVGGISPITCFSFHAVKNLTCGEGGAVSLREPGWEKKLREMRWLGISKDTYARTSKENVYAWQYSVEELGYKYHMHDIAAAMGLVQLKRLEENNNKRREIAERYSEAFSSCPAIEIPEEKEFARSSWHIYPIKVERRDGLIGYLKEHGIAPGVHYYPIHLHPYYADEGHDCPVAERIWRRILSLPIFPDLSESDQDRIIECVLSFCDE